MPYSLSKQPWIKVVPWLIVLISICTINYLLFPVLFSTNYLRWYVSAGPFIGLATAAFAAAWGKLDNNIGLVSANPLLYIGSWLQVAGLPLQVFGGHIRPKNLQSRASSLDLLFVLPLVVVFVVAVFAWLWLIAPLQYFVFLVCGAPSRIARASSLRVHAQLDDERLKFEELSSGDMARKEGWDVSMRDKPVTLTNAFSAATLFLVGKFWG